MASNASHSGYVRKQTLLIAVIVAFLAGAFVGVQVQGLLKSEAPQPGPTAMAPQSAPQGAPQQMPPQASPAATGPSLQSLEAAAAKNPSDPEAWAHLGNAYFDTDQYAKAIDAYSKSLALKQDQPDVWTDMGVMYRGEHQPAEAIKAFDKAIELKPDHAIARFNKGIVYLHDMKDKQKALQAWEDLLKIDPMAKAPDGTPVADLLKELRASK